MRRGLSKNTPYVSNLCVAIDAAHAIAIRRVCDAPLCRRATTTSARVCCFFEPPEVDVDVDARQARRRSTSTHNANAAAPE